MILPDSSVWMAHFRRTNAALAELLETDEALCHPFIVGELACGDLSVESVHNHAASDSPRGTDDAA